MKNSTFAILALLGALALGGAAFLFRNHWSAPVAVPSDAAMQEGAPSPLNGYQLLETAGAVYDGDLDQWSFCDETTLLGQSGAPVYAFMDGMIEAVSYEAHTLTLEAADGTRLVYEGVSPSLWTNARCKTGDVIGFLTGDILALHAERDGIALDALSLLP